MIFATARKGHENKVAAMVRISGAKQAHIKEENLFICNLADAGSTPVLSKQGIWIRSLANRIKHFQRFTLLPER